MSATRRGPCAAAFSRCGKAARVVESMPLTLTSIIRSQSSASAPTTGPRSISPALLTRVSSRPNRATACCTAPSACVRSVMSAATTSELPPASSISVARVSRRSLRRATSTDGGAVRGEPRSGGSANPAASPRDDGNGSSKCRLHDDSFSLSLSLSLSAKAANPSPNSEVYVELAHCTVSEFDVDLRVRAHANPRLPTALTTRCPACCSTSVQRSVQRKCTKTTHSLHSGCTERCTEPAH